MMWGCGQKLMAEEAARQNVRTQMKRPFCSVFEIDLEVLIFGPKVHLFSAVTIQIDRWNNSKITTERFSYILSVLFVNISFNIDLSLFSLVLSLQSDCDQNTWIQFQWISTFDCIELWKTRFHRSSNTKELVQNHEKCEKYHFSC